MAFVAPLQDTEAVRHKIVSVIGGAGGRRRPVDTIACTTGADCIVDG